VRYWVILACFGITAFAAPNFGTPQLSDPNGRVLRGSYVRAFSVTVSADADETITSLTITANAAVFNRDGSDIIGMKLAVISDGVEDMTRLANSTLSNTATNTVTFTGGGIRIGPTERELYILVYLAPEAPLGNTYTLTISDYTSGGEVFNNSTTPPTIDEDLTNQIITVLGVDVDVAMDSQPTAPIIYDMDLENAAMIHMTVTPGNEDFYLRSISVTNADANFDVAGDDTGVVDVQLWRSDDSIWGINDELIAGLSNNNVTFLSPTQAKIDLSYINDLNDNKSTLSLTNNTLHHFFITYTISPNTPLLQNPTDSNADATAVSARITALDGYGAETTALYRPPATAFTQTNTRRLAGLSLVSLQSIVPSINIAASLTDVPLMQLVVRGVTIPDGKTITLNNLVITSPTDIFDAFNNQSGITQLHLVKESAESGGVYNGYTPPSTDEKITVTATIDSERKITLSPSDDASLSFTGTSSKTYYILGDFGRAMAPNTVVDLRIDGESSAIYNSDAGDTSLKLSANFPLTVTPPVTVIDPAITVTTVKQLSNGLTFVAGMYTIPIQSITCDVAQPIPSSQFVFKSPFRFFSNTSTGIASLSLYIDADGSETITSGDIFLGASDPFTESGTIATIPRVSLPEGNNQTLLVMMRLGQRVPETTNQLSIQLANVIADGYRVAGVFPAPITPSTNATRPHAVQISHLSTDLPDKESITPDSAFDVTISVSKVDSAPTASLTVIDGAPESLPKFYINAISGPDRSYEFVSKFLGSSRVLETHQLTISSPNITMTFKTQASQLTSGGNYIIDADIYYTVTGDNYPNYPIQLTRSKGVGTDYKSATDLSATTNAYLGSAHKSGTAPSATTTRSTYTWSMPNYIDTATVRVSNQWVSFNNYESIPQNAPLRIELANKGRDMDLSRLTLTLNGTPLSPLSDLSASGNSYEYDTSSGILHVSSLGSVSGQLTLTAADLMGNPYPDAPFIFYTSETLTIEKLLVYPNPYTPKMGELRLGFSLTQPATVAFRVYDAMGREFARLDETHFPMGYSTHSLVTTRGSALASGTYYITMKATSADGHVARSTTKLAVY
jgi:hypothetical protein